MSVGVRRLALTLALSVIAANALGAEKTAPKPAATPEAPAPAAEPPPPYEPQLLRLAEVMGALAWLRGLCGGHDADVWRARMASLLEVEAKSEARKEMLAGAYNRGFRGYQLSYRLCTPAAQEVVARFLDEASRISADVANRYGG